MDRGQPELVDPADGGTESDRLADGGGAALELGRRSAQVISSLVTFRIIEPPPMNGGISSSSSRRPNRAPIPVGPYILCPVTA